MISLVYNEIFSNERYIPFENLRNRGIQKDDKSNIDVSFFREIYHQARNLTKVIIESNQSLDEAKDANVFQQTFDMQNIVAFTGRRGTGKTSAMLAFVDFLADNCTGLRDDFLELSKDYKFFVLQYVDSSAVSNKEDFFEILLFRMLQYLNYISENSSITNRQRMNAELATLRGDITKVYSHYSSLSNRNFDESASYTRMEIYISKHDVRREFRELVSDYNEFLLKYSGDSRSKKGFLVLCIDDIDMSRQEHLKILQCIYQYFMIPGVIVYMTMNTPILMANVKKNFYESMDINAQEEKERILELSKEQTNDFLRKILPSDMRITMPSWRKYDYRKLATIKIILKREGIGEQELEKIFPNLKGADWCLKPEGDSWDKSLSHFHTDIHGKKYVDVSPKLFMMKLLAERTKIFLDPQGYKPHFMEPNSLRHLYDTFYLLYNMQNITNHYDDIKCEYNRKILLDYLYFKMIPEMQLSNEEDKLIRSIQSEPMSRRGRRIWEYYFKKIDEKSKEIDNLYAKNEENGFVNKEKDKHKIVNYNMGEMFRCLYFGSRLDLFRKDFVKAILASYSFALPQLVEKEKYKKNEYDMKRLSKFIINELIDRLDDENREKLKKLFGLNEGQLNVDQLKIHLSKHEHCEEDLISKFEDIKIKQDKTTQSTDNHEFLISNETNAAEVWINHVYNIEEKSHYKDSYFYHFRELRDVFGYSLLGSWNNELFNKELLIPSFSKWDVMAEFSDRSTPEDVIRKVLTESENLIDKESEEDFAKYIKGLISALLFLPISSKAIITINDDEEKCVGINTKIDPTALFLGSIKVSRILNYVFVHDDFKFDIAELILYAQLTSEDKKHICKGFSNVENDLVKNFKEKAKEIRGVIIKEIIKQYFNIDEFIWFFIEHMDITYNVIKRTVAYFLYPSDESLQYSYKNDKRDYVLFENFYERFDQKMKEITDDFEGVSWLHFRDNKKTSLLNYWKSIGEVRLKAFPDSIS